MDKMESRVLQPWIFHRNRKVEQCEKFSLLPC